MAKEQRLVHFSGFVQGVGFRYAAYRAATSFEVTGYVRNLDDGRVECLFEGESNEIDACVAELAHRMRGYVQKTEYETMPFTGQHQAFEIVH